MTKVEQAHLHMRVIALENLVIALLAGVSDDQRERARAMAIHISPRAGFTAHALTLEAAAEIKHLVTVAERLNSARQNA